MPPKDVKSAKKLYAKMKKEQKKDKDKGTSESLSRETETPEPETENATSNEEQTPETELPANTEPEHSSSEETSTKDAEDSETHPEFNSKQGIDLEENPSLKQETKTGATSDNEVKPEDAEQEQKDDEEQEQIKQQDNEPKQESQHLTGSDGNLDATPSEIQVTEGARQNYDATDVEKSSSTVEKVNRPVTPSEPTPDVASIKLEAESNKDCHSSEDFLKLQQENETLKQYVKKLESKVTRLENELSALRQSETMSLSPQLPEGNLNLPNNRNRASSFVEADLYSEADKISARNEQMRRWEGYQVDLRNWAASKSFGKLVVI